MLALTEMAGTMFSAVVYSVALMLQVVSAVLQGGVAFLFTPADIEAVSSVTPALPHTPHLSSESGRSPPAIQFA